MTSGRTVFISGETKGEGKGAQVAHYLCKLVPRNPSMLTDGPTDDEESVIAELFPFRISLTGAAGGCRG
jgi:hypothetical protein